MYKSENLAVRKTSDVKMKKAPCKLDLQGLKNFLRCQKNVRLPTFWLGRGMLSCISVAKN